MAAKLNEQKVAEIKKLYEEKVPIQEIARRLGVSSGTAWRYTRAEELGYSSFADYIGKRAQERGFDDLEDYRNKMAQKNGFRSKSHYNYIVMKESGAAAREKLNAWAHGKGFESYQDYSRHQDTLKQLRPENRILSGLIQMRLEEMGNSISWLAEQLGINQTTASRYYHGTRLPTVDVQERLFQKLELPYRTIDDIVEVK
ncbi:helix-turn-helix domain-containing protein [Candidatus Woesearchaeota archaeon]|nr:helix-turn-helix domain-containing protein [Candidatus Woesearchaeota archaeon]